MVTYIEETEELNNKSRLYGDGVHDDTDAIQQMIDSGECEVRLPAPKDKYIISKPLVIPSNFKLVLPRFAQIKLADNSNCFMLQSKTVKKYDQRLPDYFEGEHREHWNFVNELSPDECDTCHDFEIEGGIWNCNNKNQTENPIYRKSFQGGKYLGYGMFFYNVRNFRLSNMTIKDPTNYAVMIDMASYFTVENITFDFNDGNPIASNMDGIHLDGNCHYGVIRNLKGACYDDLVALNAHEGSSGDITNIEIDGIFAQGCHSAVRLLTALHRVENITISNVFGTYYQYCIGFTKYYRNVEALGKFDAITLNNINVSKAKRLPIQEVHMGTNTWYHFPLIWVQAECNVKNLVINNLHRNEYENNVDTIRIDKTATVEYLAIRNAKVENHLEDDIKLFVNKGIVKSLYIEGTDDEIIENDGVIEKRFCPCRFGD